MGRKKSQPRYQEDSYEASKDWFNLKCLKVAYSSVPIIVRGYQQNRSRHHIVEEGERFSELYACFDVKCSFQPSEQKQMPTDTGRSLTLFKDKKNHFW